MSTHPFLKDIVGAIEKFPQKGADTIEFSVSRNGDEFDCQAEYWPLDKDGSSEATGRLLTDDGQMLEATTGEVEEINGKLEADDAYSRQYNIAQRQWSKTRDGMH